MPNLTGVGPYLYSLHSRFCFKGFVYTRPINHLLPSHNPTAFKVGARPGDNVQHRCQRKSLFLLRLKKEMKIPRPLVTFSSQVPPLSLLYSALGLDRYLDVSLQLGPQSAPITKHSQGTLPGHEPFWPTNITLCLYSSPRRLTDTTLTS